MRLRFLHVPLRVADYLLGFLMMLLVGTFFIEVIFLKGMEGAGQTVVSLTIRRTLRRDSLLQVYEQDRHRLIAAYPDFLVSTDSQNVVLWCDSTFMPFDDGKPDKDFETLLNEPDLQDQMVMHYTAGVSFILLEYHDPGRIRYEPFFKKMYGATEAEVMTNLETVYWLPSSINKPLPVTRINGVSERLQALSNKLDSLERFHKYLVKPAGTFNWRVISGTRRLSSHSFGIAIDINVGYSNYWQWGQGGDRGTDLRYYNRIPLDLVEIFEKYGFIWGGKWYHYDTMHFEYRPELLNAGGSDP